MYKFIAKYRWQHALSIGAAIALGVYANNYLAFSRSGWILIATFLVMQTTRGTPIRQILIYALSMLIALLTGYFLINYVNNIYLIQFIMAIMFIGSMYFLLSESLLQNKRYFFLFPLIFSLLINVLFSENVSPSALSAQIIDIVMGTVLGFFCIVLIFPVKLDYEFKRGVIPILETIKQYMQSLSSVFTNTKQNQSFLATQTMSLENSLLSDNNLYPEWVYETGFNPGLRSGFRFFLLQIEHIAGLLFSITYQVEKKSEFEIYKPIAPLIEIAMEKKCRIGWNFA